MKRLCVGLILSCVSMMSTAMDGGANANPALYPGQVMMSYNSLVTSLFINPTSRCSGVVLDKRHVLTTASCVYKLDFSLNPDQYVPVTPLALYIHPSVNGEVGNASTAFPIIRPEESPNIRVTSYVLHPKSSPPVNGTFPGERTYNLAILTLAQDIAVPPATLYHGKNKFLGETATALGWDVQSRRIQTSPFTSRFEYFFRLNLYNTTILSPAPAAAGDCRGTLYCTGFSSSAKNIDSRSDKSAPMYKIINGKRVIIGLAVETSNGIFSPLTERYGHINSSMYDFIKQHVPATRFWSEQGGTPIFQNKGLIPILYQLLLQD